MHQPLQRTSRPSSPTKSTYRVRWREIHEWADFVTEAQEYWDDLDNSEKNEVIQEAPLNYWDVWEAGLVAAMPTVSREVHLLIPFTFKYSIPHNHAIPGARDNHSRIAMRVPDITIGQPDACFEYDDKVSGIIEVKTFWNLTRESIVEVIRGPPCFQTIAYSRHSSIIRRPPWSSRR